MKRFLCSIIGWLCVVIVLQAAEARKIEPDTLKEAEKLLGLEFTDKEREQMTRSLNSRRDVYDALRRETIPNELTPSLIFDPRPRGFVIPKPQKEFHWKPAKNVSRPKFDDELAFLTVADLAALLKSRQITSEELTKLSLDRLKKFGPRLNCLVTLAEERALAEARRADEELRRGHWRGPLHGIPYGAKDLLDTRGIPTSWGVSILTNRVPQQDAAVIQKLSAAGAVLVAKLSLGELAMGDVWFGGKTRNPWNTTNGSSGSSAGSAAAVAAGLVPFAIGSETLGSIVSPCTICGTTGLRPTFGRVSRAGAMALSWSMDKLGPIARNAQDCALVFDAIRGADPNDPSTIEAPFSLAPRDIKKLRIGYLKSDFEKPYQNSTNDAASLEALRKLGFNLREVTLPRIPKEPLNLILIAEAAAAFDDLTRSNQDDQLVQQEGGSWPNSFRAARFIPAVEYLQANRLRTRLIETMDDLFEDIDVLIAPSWQGNQLLISNLTGHPTVVVPNADKTGGAPASICFLGKLFGEADALAVAEAYQQATRWHRQRPDIR